VDMNSEDRHGNSENVRSVTRAFKILEVFGDGTTGLTLSEIAKASSLTRGTARRLLLTLHSIGYVSVDRSRFVLSPKVLTLAHSYLSAVGLTDVIRQIAPDIIEDSEHISASAAVLDDGDIVFVYGQPANGIIRSYVAVGQRLPAYSTSMGRVLLAHQPSEKIQEILFDSTIAKLTTYTEVDPCAIQRSIYLAKENGYSICDREFDVTIKSLAVPIFDHNGACIAAISISCHNLNINFDDVVEIFLPKLQRASIQISRNLRI